MNWTLAVARRLRIGGNSGGSGRTGAVIAVVGVALAVLVMDITLGVVFGFKEQIRAKLMGFDGQVTVMPPYDYTTATLDPTLEFSSELADAIKRHVPEAEVVPALRLPAMLKTDNDFSAVYLTARGPEYTADFERSNIVAGVWPDFADEDNAGSVVVSEATANALGLELGDRIWTYFFVDDEGVKARRVTVNGIYRSDFGEYDAAVAYASMDMLRDVLDLDADGANSVELRGLPDNRDAVADASARLSNGLLVDFQLGNVQRAYPVTDVLTTGASYFSWLDLLDTNVVVIFILMLLVAGFTLVSSLFIIILERIPTIGLLRSLGASRPQVARIFADMAMRLVLTGMVIGNVLGLAFLLVQQQTGLIKLDPAMYYLSAVPVSLHWWPMLLLNIGTFIVAWGVVMIPARSAARIDPSETMRYE